MTTCASAVLALHHLDSEKLALIHPPWMSDELTQMGAAWFRHQGIDVVHASSAELLGGQFDLHPGQLYEWARRNFPDSAEAVFFGGNGMGAVGVIEVLEEDLGRPVLTANQVLLWQALRVAGANVAVERYGRLFSRPLLGKGYP